MADIRIKDLATTATTTASDDFMAVDGAINGTRKLSAATPAFLTSVTTPSLTSPASTDLTLAGGSSGASLVLGQGTTAADITFTPKGTGEFKWTGSTFRQTAVSPDSTGYVIPGYATGTNPDAGSSRGVSVDLINLSATNENGTALTFSNSNQLSSAYIFGQNLSHAGRTGNIIFGTANGSAPNERARITSTGNLLIGTTSETGLTGAGGLKVASTTAGSSGAGALVVQGGISAGNTGAASYFGGTVRASNVGALGKANDVVDGGSVNDFGIGTYGTATNIIFATGTAFVERARISDTGLAVTGALSTTGAATFAGAVTIGNTVNTVSPTSPNRTVTMVVNGVTLYLAAKTTND